MSSFRGIMKAIGLILLGVFLLIVVAPFFKPVPRLAQGVTFNEKKVGADDTRNAKLTARLLDEFPLGSPASLLEMELQREGWGPVGIDSARQPPWHVVQFKRSIPMPPIIVGFFEVTTIMWREDQDQRIIELVGGYYRDCAYCP